ncbi:MAG TPA: integron integrase, partial [Gemmatimonadaceae bacterium]
MAEPTTRERLIPAARRAMRTRHLSRLTEEAYVRWIVRYVRFHGVKHPRTLGEKEMREFLSHLAADRNVAASTQSQALAALLFLYTEVLRDPAPWIEDVVRARRPQRLPVVMTREEVRAVLAKMSGSPRLVALLLYGSGLRLMEALRLRVKDVDFGMNQITVRSGKGDRDRVTMLPAAARLGLERHVTRVRRLHARDLAAGAGRTILPQALARKYPNAAAELPWQWVFPSTRMAVDSTTRARYRHHLHETVVQREMRDAVKAAGVLKRATCH